MAKIIYQATFDEIVKENIIDFSMNPEEAKEETIKQLEAQGINLSNIIKDLTFNEKTGEPVLNEDIEKLKMHISGEKKLSNDELIKNIQTIDSECKKSVAHRVLAAKNEAHEILLSLIDHTLGDLSEISPSTSSDDIDNETLLNECLKAENSLINKQPDIFDAEALNLIIKIFKTRSNSQILCKTLQWIQKACVMHEVNRQDIVKADILKYLKPLIFSKDPKILKEVCACLRYFTLDDDIRAQFGLAHEHARLIASEVLTDLTELLKAHKEDVNILCDLILTIASLTVRQEFCLAIENINGVKTVLNLAVDYPESAKLCKEILKLLRALAGHDAVKTKIIEEDGASIIQDILNTHKANDVVVAAGLACVSTLTLRSKSNSLEFFKINFPQTIVELQKLYPKNKIIQRNAAWAIRNMVSRSREHNESFIELHVEEILNNAAKEHPSIEQDIKAALRDLGLKVKLKEEWTGKAEIKISN